jgi:DNA excision repair protein ERCC-2
LSVRELAELAPPGADLVPDVAWRSRTRLLAGQRAHKSWQDEQRAAQAGFRAEKSLRTVLVLEGWTITITGRVDGLTDEDGRLVVDELKSTALDAGRLYATRIADWPGYAAQLEVYVWMLHAGGRPDVQGRLVLASLLDGAHHVLILPYDHAAVDGRFQARLRGLVLTRERRNAWMAQRPSWTVPPPFGAWREGQLRIRDAVEDALDSGQRLLVEAPTGLGKTAAVLHGVLSHALRTNRRVFWATSRNTQAAGVMATLDRFRANGLDLRAVALRSKVRACLNDAVICRADRCRHAAGYFERRDAAGVVPEGLRQRMLTPAAIGELGARHVLCPHALGLDLTDEADVIVGDVNHALSPWGAISRLFSDDNAGGTILVVDEAHQLVERARDHASPRLRAADLRRAIAELRARDPVVFAPWIEILLDALDTLDDVLRATPGPLVDGAGSAEILLDPWRQLADRVDGLALDYERVRPRGEEVQDAWTEVAWSILRFVELAETADEATQAIARVRAGEEELRLVCLNPGVWLAPRVAALGGFVGVSATLSPHPCWQLQLGLPADTARVEVDSPFAADRRAVLVAKSVSTAWKHRAKDAVATAALVDEVLAATPGNVALFAPSFEMLDDVISRLTTTRPVLRQATGATEEEHAALLAQLPGADPPVVLAAVTGGVYGEGIDPPPGALDAVILLGPALPPPDLERRLIAAHLEEKIGRGFVHAFLVPGLVRVAQAGGRLVRRPEDRGVVVLIDARFAHAGVQKLLPRDWSPTVVEDLGVAVAAFFAPPD